LTGASRGANGDWFGKRSFFKSDNRSFPGSKEPVFGGCARISLEFISQKALTPGPDHFVVPADQTSFGARRGELFLNNRIAPVLQSDN
jgi:hypothetical protein